MKKFFSVRWILTTLLVIAGVGVLIRLGFWQLDRLAQRKEFNSRVTAQLNAPPLDLNAQQPVDQLYDMEYRTVTVSGEYDFSEEILLRNQVWDGKLGYRVLTPLKIDGTHWSVLVDRGWIPFDAATPADLPQYNEPGQVTVTGMLRRPELKPDYGGVPDPTLAPGQSRLDTWNIVNVERIQEQTSETLLPIWVQEAPDPAWTSLPNRALPVIEISEGPHMGYAIQWFCFAAILGLGYPFYVRKQLTGKKKSPKNGPELQGVNSHVSQSSQEKRL